MSFNTIPLRKRDIVVLLLLTALVGSSVSELCSVVEGTPTEESFTNFDSYIQGEVAHLCDIPSSNEPFYVKVNFGLLTNDDSLNLIQFQNPINMPGTMFKVEYWTPQQTDSAEYVAVGAGYFYAVKSILFKFPATTDSNINKQKILVTSYTAMPLCQLKEGGQAPIDIDLTPAVTLEVEYATLSEVGDFCKSSRIKRAGGISEGSFVYFFPFIIDVERIVCQSKVKAGTSKYYFDSMPNTVEPSKFLDSGDEVTCYYFGDGKSSISIEFQDRRNCELGCNNCNGEGNPTTCSECNTAGNFEVDGDACKCDSTGEKKYLSGQSCNLCDGSCNTCNSGGCTDCKEANAVPKQSDSQICVSCPGTCSSCNDDGECAGCKDINQQLLASGCITCDGGCSSCTEANSCATCNPGLFKKNGGCVPCDAPDEFQAFPTCFDCRSGCSCSSPNSCDSCLSMDMYDNGSNCIACDQNGEVKSGRNCALCRQGCNCDAPGECRECFEPNRYNDGTNCVACTDPQQHVIGSQCVLCGSGCDTCDLDGNCLTCIYESEGHVVSGKECFKCRDGCSKCSKTGGCDECNNAMDYNTGTECISCKLGCTECDTAQGCTACPAEKYLVEGSGCFDCGPGCATCSEDDKCKTCLDGFIYKLSDTKECRKCGPGCETCSQENECDTCIDKTQFPNQDNNECYACHPSCSECSKNGGCTKCKTDTDHLEESLEQCFTCGKDCKTCRFEGGCDTCKDEILVDTRDRRILVDVVKQPMYKNLELNKCFDCGSKCATCTEDTGCDSCTAPAFHIHQKNCYKCGEGCATCTEDGGCDTCTDEKAYKNEGQNKCYLCGDGCSTCDKTGGCLTCKVETDYRKIEDEKCYTCGEGCNSCDKNGGCLTCSAATPHLEDSLSKCLKCGNNCQTCKHTGGCDTCKAPDTMYRNTNLEECFTCGNDCASCDKDAGCDSCNLPAFYIYEFNCLECGTRCASCTEAKGCDTCKEASFYKNIGNKECYQCGKDCSTCDDQLGCTKCIRPDLFKNDGKRECYKCGKDCSSCDRDGGCDNCVRTTDYRNIKLQMCFTCGFRCADCQVDGGCDSCKFPGDYNAGSDCFTCGSQCATCRKQGGCNSCKLSNYYINAVTSTCLECMEHCTTCTDDSSCTACESGYELNSNRLCVAESPEFAVKKRVNPTFKPNRISGQLYFQKQDQVDFKRLENEENALVTEMIPVKDNNVLPENSTDTTSRIIDRRALQSQSIKTTVKKDQLDDIFIEIDHSGYPAGRYIATVTPADGIFQTKQSFHFDVTVEDRDKNSTEKLQDLIQDWAKILRYLFKVMFVVAIIAKIILDLVLKDLESQGFLVTFIFTIKMLNRMRYINVNYGIATSSLFDEISEISFMFKEDRSDIRKDSMGVDSKFYAYNIPSFTFFAMPIISVLYPVAFIVRQILRNGFKLGVGPESASFVLNLVSYYFLKLYFILFSVSAIDITFFGVRSLSAIDILDTRIWGLISFAHALILLFMVSLDTAAVLCSVFQVETSPNVLQLWKGCFSPKGTTHQTDNSRSESNPSHVATSEQSLRSSSDQSTFTKVWWNAIGALHVLGESSYEKRDGLLVFTFYTKFESILSFLRPILFNLIVVAQNENIIVGFIMLIVIEIVRFLLVFLKSFASEGMYFLERVRLMVCAVEAILYIIFDLCVIYCFYIFIDRTKTVEVPFRVQLAIILVFVLILILAFVQIVLCVLMMLERIAFPNSLEGGHFSYKPEAKRREKPYMIEEKEEEQLNMKRKAQEDVEKPEVIKPIQDEKVEPVDNKFDDFDMAANPNIDDEDLGDQVAASRQVEAYSKQSEQSGQQQYRR